MATIIKKYNYSDWTYTGNGGQGDSSFTPDTTATNGCLFLTTGYYQDRGFIKDEEYSRSVGGNLVGVQYQITISPSQAGAGIFLKFKGSKFRWGGMSGNWIAQVNGGTPFAVANATSSNGGVTVFDNGATNAIHTVYMYSDGAGGSTSAFYDNTHWGFTTPLFEITYDDAVAGTGLMLTGLAPSVRTYNAILGQYVHPCGRLWSSGISSASFGSAGGAGTDAQFEFRGKCKYFSFYGRANNSIEYALYDLDTGEIAISTRSASANLYGWFDKVITMSSAPSSDHTYRFYENWSTSAPGLDIVNFAVDDGTGADGLSRATYARPDVVVLVGDSQCEFTHNPQYGNGAVRQTDHWWNYLQKYVKSKNGNRGVNIINGGHGGETVQLRVGGGGLDTDALINPLFAITSNYNAAILASNPIGTYQATIICGGTNDMHLGEYSDTPFRYNGPNMTVPNPAGGTVSVTNNQNANAFSLQAGLTTLLNRVMAKTSPGIPSDGTIIFFGIPPRAKDATLTPNLWSNYTQAQADAVIAAYNLKAAKQAAIVAQTNYPTRRVLYIDPVGIYSTQPHGSEVQTVTPAEDDIAYPLFDGLHYGIAASQAVGMIVGQTYTPISIVPSLSILDMHPMVPMGGLRG